MKEDLNRIKSLLSAAKIIFWDFDGVIKDSVKIKAGAYKKLFLPFGVDIAERVSSHHKKHGGLSRLEKIPLYLQWAGEEITNEKIEEFCDYFSCMVHQAVIDSPWVPGVREYIINNFDKKTFILITATPDDEMRDILSSLGMIRCFREIFGAPKKKCIAIKEVLLREACLPGDAIVIGDAKTDLDAASNNLVPFILRRTPFNMEIQCQYNIPSFGDLING